MLPKVRQAIGTEEQRDQLKVLFRTLLHELMTAKIRVTSSAIAE